MERTQWRSVGKRGHTYHKPGNLMIPLSYGERGSLGIGNGSIRGCKFEDYSSGPDKNDGEI